MKEKTKKQLMLILIFIALGFIFAWTYMQVHEQVHVAILRSYGIGTIVQVNWLSASTTPINQTQYQQNCNSDCILANNMTDVVGYHLAILIFCLTGLFFIKMMWDLKNVGFKE